MEQKVANLSFSLSCTFHQALNAFCSRIHIFSYFLSFYISADIGVRIFLKKVCLYHVFNVVQDRQ